MFRSTSPPPRWGSPQRSRSPAPSNEEPFFREKVGQHSWAVMHAVAENFPDHPTQRDQQAASAFLAAFADVYPCSSCRPAFQELIRQFPPDTSSKAAFVQWMECFHDQINMHLGKPAVNACGWPQALPTRMEGGGQMGGMGSPMGAQMGGPMGSPMSMGMSGGMSTPSSPQPVQSYPLNFSPGGHQHSPARPMNGYHNRHYTDTMEMQHWMQHTHSSNNYNNNNNRISRRSVQPIPLSHFGTMSL